MPPEDVREIIKQLEAVTHRGYSAWKVFEDWVALMFWAIQRNDEEYLKIVRRYKNDRPQGEREIDYFCNAFGLLMKEMAGTNRELLGEIYMQWEVSNKHTGQFFTPWHIAFMMAQILGPKGETINDCCCGSGIMFIAACKTMTNQQLDKVEFVGQDIDLTCVMMCALNLTFFNLNGYVIWGNSLTNERRKIFQTTRSCLGGSLAEVPVESIPLPEIPEHIIVKPESIKPEKPKKEDRQPVLF
jgi:type I restriction-modification system DNA methylase subunit